MRPASPHLTPRQKAAHPSAPPRIFQAREALCQAAAGKKGFGSNPKGQSAVRGLHPGYSFSTPRALHPLPPAQLDTAWLRSDAEWQQHAIDNPETIYGETYVRLAVVNPPCPRLCILEDGGLWRAACSTTHPQAVTGARVHLPMVGIPPTHSVVASPLRTHSGCIPPHALIVVPSPHMHS